MEFQSENKEIYSKINNGVPIREIKELSQISDSTI